MEAGNENVDLLKLVNNRGNIENITPHKIAVVAFIREYGLLKIEDKKMVDCGISPKYRKDFCMLALKLIQCPDMEFKELETLLTDGRYNLLSVHLQNFCVRLQNIYVNGISALTDCVTSTVDKLMIEHSETNPCIIARYSILGLYLRRILLNLDKLTFVQVVSLYKSFCSYYQKGRPGLINRSMSKEKLNNVEPHVSSTPSTSAHADDSKPLELSMRLNIIDRDNSFEECQWSRKQAELFTAQQANLLQINEQKAMAPKQLQKTIMQIINDVPDYPDIHFLSFLNCIRMKEFCGAQESMYNCFDRSVFNVCGSGAAAGERNKSYRYAALNRAAMHTQFGHNALAMEAVREAVSRAHEAGDAAQLVAQHTAVNGAKPATVFQILTKGDSLNYSHSLTDLTMAGLAITAALWALYGKTEMASVNCQLLLNLNTKCSVGSGMAWHCTEAAATGGTGAGAVAEWRGHGALAVALASRLAHPAAHALALRTHAHRAIYAGKWEDAEQLVKQLASSDRWESQLLKAEMYFSKGDATDALETLYDILDYCNTEDDSLLFMTLRVKAMILMSQIQHTYSNIQSTNIMILNEALTLAKKYHLHYLATLAEMHIANIQLGMGCARNALKLARKALPSIMAHGSAYDMARALFLYSKCRVATAPASGAARAHVLHSCCEALDAVKLYFAMVGAQDRIMHTLYLQAQLYNDLGNHVSRNQCAWLYRHLDMQNPLEPSKMLLIMF